MSKWSRVCVGWVVFLALGYFSLDARAEECFGRSDALKCPKTAEDLRNAKACLIGRFVDQRQSLIAAEGSSAGAVSNQKVRESLAAIRSCGLADPRLLNSSCLGSVGDFLAINSQIEGKDHDDPNAGGLGFNIPIGEYYKKYPDQTRLSAAFQDQDLLRALKVTQIEDGGSVEKARNAISSALSKDPLVDSASIHVVPGTSQVIGSLDNPPTNSYLYVAYREKRNASSHDRLDRFLIISVDSMNQGSVSEDGRHQISMVTVDPSDRKTYFANFWRKDGTGGGVELSRKHIVQRCIHCHSSGPIRLDVGIEDGPHKAQHEAAMQAFNASVQQYSDKQKSQKPYSKLAEAVELKGDLAEVKLGNFSDTEFENLCLKANPTKQECLKNNQSKMKCASCHNGSRMGILRPSLFVQGLDAFETTIFLDRMPPKQHWEGSCKGEAISCLKNLYFSQAKAVLAKSDGCPLNSSPEAEADRPEKGLKSGASKSPSLRRSHSRIAK